MTGWRKTVAWALVYALVVAATWLSKDVPDNAMDLLTYAIGLEMRENLLWPKETWPMVEIGSREDNGIFIYKNYPKNRQSAQKTLKLGSNSIKIIQKSPLIYSLSQFRRAL